MISPDLEIDPTSALISTLPCPCFTSLPCPAPCSCSLLPRRPWPCCLPVSTLPQLILSSFLIFTAALSANPTTLLQISKEKASKLDGTRKAFLHLCTSDRDCLRAPRHLLPSPGCWAWLEARADQWRRATTHTSTTPGQHLGLIQAETAHNWQKHSCHYAL